MALMISRVGHARLRPVGAGVGSRGSRIAHWTSDRSFHSAARRGYTAAGLSWSASMSSFKVSQPLQITICPRCLPARQ